MNHIVAAFILTAALAGPLSAAFTLTRVAPRVFSPGAADAAANRARFLFSNPDGAEVTIRIFDITGKLVRRNIDSESPGVMYWNGRDQAGRSVKGGVYIYQIESGQKVLTGTVVVAG